VLGAGGSGLTKKPVNARNVQKAWCSARRVGNWRKTFVGDHRMTGLRRVSIADGVAFQA
jgi:hypothetical protein